MIKHIVLWQFTDEIRAAGTEEVSALLRARFEELPGKIDGLVRIELGENYKAGPYDIALYCEFTTKEAEAAYQVHPLHLAIKELSAPWVTGRAAIDYEI
ncbi:MAG: Dabb family protein [Clostridiales bacterium]|nr:Dabb family protein [Clostridiales bacterium]